MTKKESFYRADTEAIAKLLDMPPEKIKIDRFEYVGQFPDEIKAWKFVGHADPDLRRYQGKLYYPVAALIELIDLTTELLVKNRFIEQCTLIEQTTALLIASLTPPVTRVMIKATTLWTNVSIHQSIGWPDHPHPVA